MTNYGKAIRFLKLSVFNAQSTALAVAQYGTWLLF
jgi:hypothetical protein